MQKYANRKDMMSRRKGESRPEPTADPPMMFANLNHVVYRDLNGTTRAPTFAKYSREEIITYLSNPYRYKTQLRNAVIYMYGASSNFRRLIQYFVGLNDFSYIVTPYRMDYDSAETKGTTYKKNYIKTLDFLSTMNIKTQGAKILTVCLREDVFYGTCHVTKDDITIQQLPSEYCDITSVEGNVFNVSFNFSYFDSRKDLLPFYPPEFERRYNDYTDSSKKDVGKWQELDSPTSFAIKVNSDVPDYPIPPFAGILPNLYDISDYQSLKMTKTELENYAILAMYLEKDPDGRWQMDFGKAEKYWRNLDGVLPDEVGSILSPMKLEKISFDRAGGTSTSDTVSDAEEHMFSSAGVSSQIFSSKNATSSNAMLLSIKADQNITFGIVRMIEDAINRILHEQSASKNFSIRILDTSCYNRKETAEIYLNGCRSGAPFVSAYCAVAAGLNPEEMDGLCWIEQKGFDFVSKFNPLRMSSTQSGSDGNGRPESNPDALTDEGERSREKN